MKSGPQRTNVGGFKGFGFGLQAGTSRPGAPVAARAPGAKPPSAGASVFSAASATAAASRASASAASAAGAKRAGSSGVAALFKEALEDDTTGGKAKGLPNWGKPTIEAIQAQRQAEALQAADPSIFQYDEVIDDIKEDMQVGSGSQQVHTDSLTQKKRVGLVVREGSDQVRAGAERKAKYVEKVIIATDRRRVEQQIVEDRMLKKDKDKNKDCEVFVTAGFKEELRRRQKFEEELENQDRLDAQKAADRMQDGKGFADMYRNLLNGGLASSRGGEKIREQAAPREGGGAIVGQAPRSAAAMAAFAAKEEVKDEVKEEDDEAMPAASAPSASAKEECKEEAKAELREEAGAGAASAPGVMDAIAEEAPKGTKRAREEDDKANRAEKALSAKERFLARKKAAAEAAAAAG
eukprot:TRINITY_DN4793_c0_g1_i1.p1 TRINITY_DN4793_c0_g1~~TRINITY_DN4793_c0_g1_i1.p1  ORF type:complete len:409 (-),score=137.04 TRINITY_DN4793_c0_g1_i1:58-1284(-)